MRDNFEEKGQLVALCSTDLQRIVLHFELLQLHRTGRGLSAAHVVLLDLTVGTAVKTKIVLVVALLRRTHYTVAADLQLAHVVKHVVPLTANLAVVAKDSRRVDLAKAAVGIIEGAQLALICVGVQNHIFG